METKSKLARSPDGNGGLYWALRRQGVLEDLERNDGSHQRPYYMSSALKKILGKMEQTAAEARFRSPR